MAFLKIQYYKTLINLYFFKNLNLLKVFLFKDISYIFFFLLFRVKYKKKYNYNKIIFFYNIYNTFVIHIKLFFLQNFQKSYWKIIQASLILAKYKKIFIRKKHSIYCLTFLKSNYIFIKFSFLNFFISLDILKFFFLSINNFILFYIFYAFIKLYTCRANNNLFFRNLWFLTNLYMSFLENFVYTIMGNFILKNYSNWNTIHKLFFNSCLYYFYQHNTYKICYIRSLNILHIYFFCKIKYILCLYNDIKCFLRFFLKANLFFANNFHLTLVSKNQSSKTKNLFIGENLKNKNYVFSKYKLRLYFLLFFIKIKSTKSSFYLKKLMVIFIIQAFLEYCTVVYRKKLLLRQISFITKKYFY